MEKKIEFNEFEIFWDFFVLIHLESWFYLNCIRFLKNMQFWEKIFFAKPNLFSSPYQKSSNYLWIANPEKGKKIFFHFPIFCIFKFSGKRKSDREKVAWKFFIKKIWDRIFESLFEVDFKFPFLRSIKKTKSYFGICTWSCFVIATRIV